MSNTNGNMFEGLFGAAAPAPAPVEEKIQQPEIKRTGPSEQDRKAYAAYRQAVFGYNKLIAARKQAIADLDAQKKQQADLPAQQAQLEKERQALAAEKNNLSSELSLQQSGSRTAPQFRNISCDQNTAALITSARGSMTPAQQEFMRKPCSEVCNSKVISNLVNVESLESTFKNTDLYHQLANGTISPDTVKRIMSKFSGSLFIGMMVIFLLARATKWFFLSEVASWICGLTLAFGAALLVNKFVSGFGRGIRIFATLLGGWFGLTFGSALSSLVMSGGWVTGILAAVALSAMNCKLLTKFASNQKALPLVQKLSFVKKNAQKEMFKSVENMEFMNEALYCYCNHDAIMDYFRKNASKVWMAQLEGDISSKNKQIAGKEQQINELQAKLARSQAALDAAQKRVDAANQALISANRSILAWNGQPSMEMAENQFCDLICMEKGDDNTFQTIINHNKRPIIFRYTGDVNGNPVNQIADDLIGIINGFMKLNPSELMQISLLNMSGRDIPMAMAARLDTVDWNELKKPNGNKNTDGKIFYAGNRTELNEVQLRLDEHVREITNYIKSHREQFQNGASITQVNKLLLEAKKQAKPYQVLMILVPRDREQNGMNAEILMNYLRDSEDNINRGILPVLFVNQNSIHEQWVPLIPVKK